MVLSSPRSPTRPLSGWVVAAILAVPFVVMIAVLRGLTVTLPIFHSSDEFVYHLPTILRFSGQLPFPDVGHYNAAQTPLFHVLMADVGKLVGYELWRLRLAEVGISYGLALAVYGLLARRLGIAQPSALALSLLFALSPYVYGTSFRVITDNLATLWIVIALERFERFREGRTLGPFAVGCAAVGAGILTRQSAGFMAAVAGLYVLGVPLGARRRTVAALVLALACTPAAVLFLVWHGLVPPGGDPSSCGLCGGHGGAGLVAQTPELALATIGLYGVVLFAPGLIALAGTLRRGAAPLKALRGPLIGAAAGALLLLAFPARPGADAAGVIWNIANHFPKLIGSSLLFWGLVPAAGALLVWRVRVAPRAWPVLAFGTCFLLGALAIRYPWQKYVDPFALLILLLSSRRDELASPRALAGALVLALAFIAYAGDPSSHASVARAAVAPLRAGHGGAGRGAYATAANASATFGQLTTFQNASM